MSKRRSEKIDSCEPLILMSASMGLADCPGEFGVEAESFVVQETPAAVDDCPPEMAFVTDSAADQNASMFNPDLNSVNTDGETPETIETIEEVPEMTVEDAPEEASPSVPEDVESDSSSNDANPAAISDPIEESVSEPETQTDEAPAADGSSDQPGLDESVVLTGALTDVTDGETLLGVSTGGQSTGVAEGRYSAADGFQLIATFDGLPAPLPGTFYEGWLVDFESGNFISTGELFQDADGRFLNELSDT